MPFRAPHFCPCGIAVLTLFSLLPLAAAVAQEDPAAPLEEVLVLAKKRQQAVADVDMAIKVLEPQVLQALNFRSLPQAAALVENVAMFEDFSGAALPTWVIRGVGLQDFNSNNTPTAAVYLDGAYQVATVMGAASLFDVADLEILKGPQGGLYGRNTTGGAVLLNSRRARLDRREASLDLSYGSWHTSLAQGAYNLPIGTASALRVAFNAENSRDGWQHSLTERGTQGDREKLDLRTWWRHDFSPNLRVEWKLQGGRDDSDIPLGRALGVYDASGNMDFCGPVLAGYIDERVCIDWGSVNRVAEGSGAPANLLAQSDDGKRVLSQLLNRQSNDYASSVLEWHWQGRHADFLSLTSFDRFGYGVMLDLDGSAGEYGHRYSSSDLRTWSQEFRLSAPAQSAVYWLAGLSVSGEEFAERRDFRLADNHIVRLGRGMLEYDQHTRSVSAYADLEWPLGETLALTAGLRWTDEDKHYRNGNFWMPRGQPIYLARNLRADYSLDDQLAGSLGLKWHPTDGALVYLKYSNGFKSGGFYGGFPFDPQEVEPYREETLDAWEAGLKWQLPALAMAVELAVFHYDIDDVQGFIRDINPETGTGIDRLGNQGGAEHEGVELQWRWSPFERLTLDLGLGWLDATFAGQGAQTVNLAGEVVDIHGRRPYAPRFSGSALLSYRQPLAQARQLVFDASYDYRSDFAGTQSSPVDAAINQLPGYGLVNLSLRLSAAGSPWELGAWVRNAADRAYVPRIKNDGLNSFIALYGEPRSLGLSLAYRL